jgi:acyl-CoA synthetase (AMP-forming)/AMP-acid ligase II
VGSALIKLLDENGREAPTGEPGELYSCNAWTFDGYWKLPEKTREAFKGSYCSVGDMARRDEDGYIYLVDRKSNMIISGGENVFPSDVEAVLCQHPAVQDVAVIGLPDEKWGERVHAVVVLKAGAASPDDLLGWCKDRIAGYKRPRSITYLQESEMPRTATGKILHRRLRDKILAR